MASLAEALKDKRGFPDTQEITLGDGLKITLGELRTYQEASGQDLAKQLEIERQKIAEKDSELSKAQAEVLTAWTAMKAAESTNNRQPDPSSDWKKDPFFAPIAEHLDKSVMSEVRKHADQISQFQKALGLGVKYIADTFSEMRYQNLPEEFRKEVPYDQAVKMANDKKFFDNGGIPDIRKVHDEWQSPRKHAAEIEQVRKEAYEKAQNEMMSNSLARPSGMPVAPAQADPNGPKNIRESFQRLKEDPEFNRMVYGLTGQA